MQSEIILQFAVAHLLDMLFAKRVAFCWLIKVADGRWAEMLVLILCGWLGYGQMEFMLTGS